LERLGAAWGARLSWGGNRITTRRLAVQERFNEQIRQMVPAHEGYYAVLLDTEDPYYHLERIVAWALVEYEDANSERQTRIVGLSLFGSGIWFADATAEFFEYVHEDQLTERHDRFRTQGRIYADDPEGYQA
jgi:hypothetical protein